MYSFWHYFIPPARRKDNFHIIKGLITINLKHQQSNFMKFNIFYQIILRSSSKNNDFQIWSVKVDMLQGFRVYKTFEF